MSANENTKNNSSLDWNFDAPQYVSFVKISSVFKDNHEKPEDYFTYHSEEGPIIPLHEEVEDAECSASDYDEDEEDGVSVKSETAIVNISTGDQNNKTEKSFEVKAEEIDDPSSNKVDLLANLPEYFLKKKPLSELNNISNEESFHKSEAEDLVVSPSEERSRCRRVLKVSSARKRLSMSVDRGKTRLLPLTKDKRLPSQDKLSELSKENRGVNRQLFGVSNEKELVKAITSELKEEVEEEKLGCPKIVGHTGISFKCGNVAKSTMIQPFSFEKRDLEKKQKKEEMLKKKQEEEKKARQFRAQPFPDIIYKINKQNTSVSTSNKSSYSTAPLPNRPKHKPEQNKENKKSFKARPASVLHKDPFKPSKPPKPTEKSKEFHLSTQERALKRAEWENYMKMREKEKQNQRKDAEERKKLEEAEEIKRLRAKTVHKPLPLPNFKASPDSSCSSSSQINKTCITVETKVSSIRTEKSKPKPSLPLSTKSSIPSKSKRPKSLAPSG